MLAQPTLKLIITGLLVVGGIVEFSSNSNVVQADADYDHALNTAPQGVSLNNIFQVGTKPSAGDKDSSASVQKVTNPNSPNTDAVVITTGGNQIGYIWSTEQNAFDLNQDSKSSMWMYFGDGNHAGDGMAFVLQNDPAKYAARPKFLKDNVFGETVGVWGVDSDYNRTDPNTIAKTAIQNSWALEFDTYPNNTSDTFDNAGKGDSFDLGVNKQAHIAANYPSEGSSYQEHNQAQGIFGWNKRHYFSLNHAGISYPAGLSNGQWHHLSLNWDAHQKQISYTFDDKLADGTENKSAKPIVLPIDPSKFNSSNGKILWGFTGATGGNFENNMVIFESVQGLVSAHATASIFNETQKKAVNEGDQVQDDDQLTYQYHLKYNSGKQGWDKIIADLDLPAAIKFSKAKISYADGSTSEIALKSASTLHYQLEKALNDTNSTADIELVGRAEAAGKDISVPKAKANFHANNFVTTTAAAGFIIQKKKVELQLSLNADHLTELKGHEVPVKGILKAVVGAFENSAIKVQPTLNGVELPSFSLKESAEHGLVEFTVPEQSLKVGMNDLTLVAVDQNDNHSNTAKMAIKILSGDLKFGKVADNSNFKPVQLNGQTQFSAPESDWQVQVVDERGKGSNWQLTAEATPFKDENGTSAHGGVVYTKNGTSQSLTNQSVVVQNYQTAEDEETYDVTNKWSTDQGIQYQVNAGDHVGHYSGKITWSLVNAPS